MTRMTEQLRSVAGQFTVRDLDASDRDYGALGFCMVSRHGDALPILRRDSVENHVIGHGPDWEQEASQNSANFPILNIFSFERDFNAPDLPTFGHLRYVQPQSTCWGVIEAHVVDPDGNLLISGAPIEEEVGTNG
ncbi:MAG: hypothetical protein MK098_10890 [Marinovum sp.]|nr:hypothetical protein [Marinovum sp.]